MKVRRKSLHRSANAKRARKFSNMRAAKERKRIARLSAEITLPDIAHLFDPTPVKPLFIVTIRCRDGAVERLRIYHGPHGLSPSPTKAARKIATVLTHYRPA
jgi:hypothetical protein